jgi:hypothetical protein
MTRTKPPTTDSALRWRFWPSIQGEGWEGGLLRRVVFLCSCPLFLVVVFSLVIPAQAGLRRQDAGANIRAANGPKGEPRTRRIIQLLFFASPLSAELRLACGEPVTFWHDSGHPATAPALLYLRHPCRRLPSRCATVLRGSLDVHPRTFSERAHIVCALLRAFPTHPRRASGGPVGRHPAAEAGARAEPTPTPKLSTPTPRGSAGMHGFADQGAVRGAEHRSLRGKSPQGRGEGSPRSRSGTGTVPSERPREGEKRRNTPPRMTRGGAPRQAPSLLPTFGQCQK